MMHIFPNEFVIRFNDGVDYSSFEMSSLLGEQFLETIEQLDQQSLQAIRSMIMVEYARCTQLPSEAIIKSFGGLDFSQHTISVKDMDAAKAIRFIKRNGESDAE